MALRPYFLLNLQCLIFKFMIEISNEAYLCPDGFGSANFQVIRELLNMVSDNFESWLDGAPHCLKPLIICHSPFQYPMCSEAYGRHIIFLSTEGDFWCQWVYQYAHEFCHHTIDGTLTGDNRGILWFEETICELSSWCNIERMMHTCAHSVNPCLRHFYPSVRNYHGSLLHEGEEKSRIFVGNHGGISNLLPSLHADALNRDMNKGIAFLLYPIFQTNPCLWKIILCIGDCGRWHSLEAFLDHASRHADDSWSASLRLLRKILLP